MWKNMLLDAFGIEAYYRIVCDFMKKNLTLMILWQPVSLNTLQS